MNSNEIMLLLNEPSKSFQLIEYVKTLGDYRVYLGPHDDPNESLVYIELKDSEITTKKEILTKILDDYESCGFLIEQDFNIFELTVYSNNPMLDHWFLCRRMNISQATIEAVSDFVLGIQNSNEFMVKKVETMEAVNFYNGNHKTRDLIVTLAAAMEANGIPVKDKINSIIHQSVH